MKKLFLILFSPLFFISTAFAAVGYDGTDDAHTVSNPNKGSGVAITICGHFWTAAWQDNGIVFSFGNGVDGTAGRGWSISTRDTAALRFKGYFGASSINFDSPAGLPTSTWIHFCVRSVDSGSGANEDWFIDATDGLSDSNDFQDNPTIQDATDDIIIGQVLPAATGVGFTPGIFRGADFAYYDTDLSGAQIATLADKSICPEDIETANLQFFSRLTTAGAVTDISPNLFTVVEAGNPTTQADPSSLPVCDGTGGGGGGGGAGGGGLFNRGFEP